MSLLLKHLWQGIGIHVILNIYSIIDVIKKNDIYGK